MGGTAEWRLANGELQIAQASRLLPDWQRDMKVEPKSTPPASFAAWVETVHPSLKEKGIWSFIGYQKALFAFDLGWTDCRLLLRDARGRPVADQLLRSLGAIGASIEEGYGRGFGKEYAYRLRIALGEAREAKGWYWRGRELLPAAVLDHRLALLDEVIRPLVTAVHQQRQR